MPAKHTSRNDQSVSLSFFKENWQLRSKAASSARNWTAKELSVCSLFCQGRVTKRLALKNCNEIKWVIFTASPTEFFGEPGLGKNAACEENTVRTSTMRCHCLGTCEAPAVVPTSHTENNHRSPENSWDPGDSLKGTWRPTRGWQTNTLKIAVPEKAPLYWRKKCLPFNEQVRRTHGLKILSPWFHLDCPSKLTPFIPSFLCRG